MYRIDYEVRKKQRNPVAFLILLAVLAAALHPRIRGKIMDFLFFGQGDAVTRAGREMVTDLKVGMPLRAAFTAFFTAVCSYA